MKSRKIFEKERKYATIALEMKKMIRAAAVAKHIGISSQELRKILSEVNFGVKATDREFPEAIASGMVRFISKRLRRDIPPLLVSEEEVEHIEKKEEKGIDIIRRIQEHKKERQKENATLQQEVEDLHNRKKKKELREKTPPQKNTESTLSRVTPLGSEGALARMQRLGHTKIQPKKVEPPKKTEKKHGAPAVFRKIVIDPRITAEAKKKQEAEKKSKEDRERELHEQKAMRRKKKTKELVKKEGVILIPAVISLKEFSEKVGVPVAKIVAVLMKNGIMATMTQSVDFDTLSLISEELEIQINKEEEQLDASDLKNRDITELLKDDKENLVVRPPVVVVMGHVDHGKTAILDAIRDTRIIDGESGGITQHIGAYQTEKHGKKVTFIDTPGHEAFTAMRARGSQVADIAVLVVAADEGIKPQTLEALNHAREAQLPVIVAINKIDKPEANLEKIKGQLSEHELVPEDWGGTTTCVPVSALKKTGIDDLLEMIVLQSEILELKANPNRLSVGTVLESHLDSSLGPVATVLINAGTLKIGDDFVLNESAGRVKVIINDGGKKIKHALPGMPVQIAGMSVVPATGSIFQVMPNKRAAQEKAEELQNLLNAEKTSGASLSEIMAGLSKGDMKFLKIVLRADTEGSLEAVKQAVEKIQSSEVASKIIHAAVGSITETDVMMASASKGVVFGFHVSLTPRIKRIAEKEGVEVQNYEIIYNLTDDVRNILEGLLEPERVETVVGQLEVKQIFYTKNKVAIIGCKVSKGYVENSSTFRVFRGNDEEPIGVAKIFSLQHFAKKVPQVEENQECGIQIESKFSLEEGDRLEIFKTEERIKTL